MLDFLKKYFSSISLKNPRNGTGKIEHEQSKRVKSFEKIFKDISSQ